MKKCEISRKTKKKILHFFACFLKSFRSLETLDITLKTEIGVSIIFLLPGKAAVSFVHLQLVDLVGSYSKSDSDSSVILVLEIAICSLLLSQLCFRHCAITFLKLFLFNLNF